MAQYSPSVIDQFMARAERLPGPVGLFYLSLLVGLIVIANGITWLDTSASFGTFDLYRMSVPFYPVISLALMHHLNHVARRALTAFRPALSADEAEYTRIEYELTTLPRRRTWIVLALSLLFTIVFIWFTPNLDDILSPSPWLVGLDVLLYMSVFGLISVFVYHTLRQLRMVSHIHASATNVNLFQPTPLYAFSGLTAQTGIGLLLLNYFSILTDPATFVNPALNALTMFTSLVAAACFILPLRGMHGRILAEKKRLRTEANTRLEAVIQEVYQRADTQDLSEIDQLNQLLASLITARDEVAKLPVWPWYPRTLTGFISAFLLPFIVRLFEALLM